MRGVWDAQNVGSDVVRLIIWPVWFGMDFKDAAGKEVAALQARQQHLTELAAQRCNSGYRSPPPLAYPYIPPQPAPPPKSSLSARGAPIAADIAKLPEFLRRAQ